MQHGSEKKGNKLKIIIKTPQSHATGQDDAVDDGDNSDEITPDLLTQLTEQQGFTRRELDMDMDSLWRLCVANIKWATQEGEELREECKELEEIYRQEWLEKEALVDQAVQIEEDWWQRRKAVLAAEAEPQGQNDEGAEDDSNDAIDPLHEDRPPRTSQPV
ncbi:hypothetical protein RRF57_003948 [Xylaria bambusicola]|uniref:Uncharacterized protein n=1 Tax=Xylaria bambusicola TaxID=326684 RepID=A0AAN7UIF4_9PEZI